MAATKADSRKRRRESIVIRGRDRGRGRGWDRLSQTTLPCREMLESKGRPETGKDAADKYRVSGLSYWYGFGFRFRSQSRGLHPNLNTGTRHLMAET
jgi:hypothetical protein